MKRSSLLVAAVAFALGALVFWLAFCRGESAELRREIDDALADDAADKAQIAVLRAENDTLDSTIAVMKGQLGAALDEVDSLAARPPRVIRVMVPAEGGGPAVPVDVVLASEHQELRRSCSAASALCRRTTDSLSLLAARRDTLEQKATARANELAARVAAFKVPKEPSRWGLGISGPVTLSFQNEPGRPPVAQRYGICGPVTFTFR